MAANVKIDRRHFVQRVAGGAATLLAAPMALSTGALAQAAAPRQAIGWSSD